MKFYVQFLATVDDEVDDVDDERLLLYSQAALLADFKSALSGLNFVALGLASFTVNIEPKLLNSILAGNVVLFLRTMLNTLSSDALECGSTSTSLTTLNKISNLCFPIQLLCNFIEITLQHGCSPVNLLHIFKTPFSKNTFGWLLLPESRFNVSGLKFK